MCGGRKTGTVEEAVDEVGLTVIVVEDVGAVGARARKAPGRMTLMDRRCGKRGGRSMRDVMTVKI